MGLTAPQEKRPGLKEKRIHVWEAHSSFLGAITVPKATAGERVISEAFLIQIMDWEGGRRASLSVSGLLAGGLAADTEPPKYSIFLLRYEWKDSNIKRDHDCKEFCIVLGT